MWDIPVGILPLLLTKALASKQKFGACWSARCSQIVGVGQMPKYNRGPALWWTELTKVCHRHMKHRASTPDAWIGMIPCTRPGVVFSPKNKCVICQGFLLSWLHNSKTILLSSTGSNLFCFNKSVSLDFWIHSLSCGLFCHRVLVLILINNLVTELINFLAGS